MKKAHSHTRGFTLIEMIVASGMFVIAITIILGAVVSLDVSSRHMRNFRIATDNVSAALDSISRNIRMGAMLHCGAGGDITKPQNCPMTDSVGGGGDTFLAFESQDGDLLKSTDQYAYRLNNGAIERTTDSGTTWLALTSPEVTIRNLHFYVGGTESNLNQPYVTIIVQGTTLSTGKNPVEFNVETTISQRTPSYNFTP